MGIETSRISLSTKGYTDIFDITKKVDAAVSKSGFENGTVTVFVPGSTGGVTTVEYEPGLVKDIKEIFERLFPYEDHYEHNAAWGDGNGSSHIRASLLGPSITVPFVNGEMTLGTWQQIIFIDFDTKGRSREIVVQVAGE